MSDWNWLIIIGVVILIVLLNILEQLKSLNRTAEHWLGSIYRSTEEMREDIKAIATDASSLQINVEDIATRAATQFPSAQEIEEQRYDP